MTAELPQIEARKFVILLLFELICLITQKKNCFQVVTSERTYLIYSEDERDMKEWMRAIESLSELHKSRDKWEGR